MAKAEASSPLDDLDLSGEEVRRLTSAFQDPEFRRMFSEYAEELNDPENRRRYEEDITALERERGVRVQFVHPEPGYVLRTSLDGARRCFVNVCSNALVGAPRGQPGRGDGAAPGSHWSLPYSLAPGRQYAGRRGSRYTVYDVVFHPGALALARRHQRFRQMLDATALEAVEKQFGVRLDCRNAKTLRIKYKGTPEAAVLRTPLPEGAPARPDGEAEDPLPAFPYPYPRPATAQTAEAPAPPAPEAARPPAPTEPRCSVVQRHHVDLQDYRCSRDSAPGPVPHELVVTIELPLLRSAEQVALEVTGKLLSLDSRRPDYRLRLPLPYAVDDSRGKAQFNRARRQLQVTLPVLRPAALPEPAAAPEEWAGGPGTDGEPAGAGEEADPEPQEPEWGGSAVSPPGLGEQHPPAAETSAADAPAPSSPGLDSGSPSGRGGACGDLCAQTRQDAGDPGGEPSDPAMGGPGADRRDPLCPLLQCNQDEESLTLLVQVPGIQPQSLQGDLSPAGYKLCFSAQDAVYSFFLQFAPENKLSTKEPAISVSAHNAAILLTKSPESHGSWREWYCGLNKDSLEERLFVTEENVNEFLEEVLSSPYTHTRPLTPPAIEVLQVTEEKIRIHAKLQECSNPDQLQGKEKGVHEECSLTENVHPPTSPADSDSSVVVTALDTDTCGSLAGFQQESDVSQVLFGKSQHLEAKMKPDFIKEKIVTYSNEEKDNLNEPVITEEKKSDGDHSSLLLNKSIDQNISDFSSIKETNMQDGTVQIIKDHVTHCAFSFENPLLYDLD